MNNKNKFILSLLAILGACSVGAQVDVPLGSAAGQSAPVAMPSGSALSRYLTGVVADVRGDEVRAAAAYDDSLSQDNQALPTSLAMRALEKHLLLADVSAAIKVAQQSRTAGGDALMQWVVLLADAIQRDDLTAARTFLTRAQNHLPELVQLRLLESYLDLATLKKAASLAAILAPLKEAEINEGYLARLAYHRARMALRLGQPMAARESLEDAQKLEVGALFTSRLLAREYVAANEMDKAVAVLKGFRDKHAAALLLADVDDAAFFNAEAARARGDTIQDDAAETLFGLSVLLWAQGAETPARQFMALALYLAPEEPFMPYYAGVLAESTAAYTMARQYYQAMENTPGLRLAAASRLAAVARAEADYPRAVAALKRGLLVDETNQILRVQLAQVHETAKDYRAAIDVYDGLLESLEGGEDTLRSDILFARGAAYERLGEISRATLDMQAALKIAPENPMILNYLGYMWVDADIRLKEGLEMLKKAHKLAPNSAAILDSLGWAYYKLKQYPQALLYITRAVDAEPEDATLQSHLGDVYAALGNLAAAQKHWQRALELGPETTSEAQRLQKLIED